MFLVMPTPENNTSKPSGGMPMGTLQVIDTYTGWFFYYKATDVSRLLTSSTFSITNFCLNLATYVLSHNRPLSKFYNLFHLQKPFKYILPCPSLGSSRKACLGKAENLPTNPQIPLAPTAKKSEKLKSFLKGGKTKQKKQFLNVQATIQPSFSLMISFNKPDL